ncbi:hypothetical protein T439DRAFT_329042 [Meredithblackwellia eburnea MCA 4105]
MGANTARSPEEQQRIRAAINLKTLKRHDSKIEAIVSQSTYAIIYTSSEDDKGEFEWVKTGVEGPMFLFQRSEAPYYGFIVINQKGMEYVYELLTPELDAVEEQGMIMFRTSVDEDRATGIWLHDAVDRQPMFKLIDQHKRAPPPPKAAPIPPPAPSTGIAYNQSIPLDVLFAASQSETPPPMITSPPPVPATLPNHSTGLDLLNSIFASATPKQPTISPSIQPASLPISSMVDATPTPPTHTQSPPPLDAKALLAMIGHPGGAGAQMPTPPIVSTPPASSPRAQPQLPKESSSTSTPQKQKSPLFAPPILSHDIFAALSSSPSAAKSKPATSASAPVTSAATPTKAQAAKPPLQQQQSPSQSQLKPKPKTQQPQPTNPHIKVPAKHTAATALVAKPSSSTKDAPVPVPKELASALLDDSVARAQLGMAGAVNGNVNGAEPEPLGKKEFLRGVEELLQKPSFATALYSKYLARFSEEMEKREA